MLYALILSIAFESWSSEKPAALTEVETSRAGIVTAEIVWRRRAPAMNLPLQRYITRIAADEIALTELGDERGARMVQRNGDRFEGIPEAPGHWLFRGGEAWNKLDNSLTAKVYGADKELETVDLRGVGLFPSPKAGADWLSYLPGHEERGATEFCAERAGSRLVVSARSPSAPERVTRWTLDPKFGGQPTRCELLVGGEVVRVCEVVYKDAGGGEFFPAHAAYSDGASVAAFEITVESARLNEPELPAELLPADIGVGNGINIRFQRGHPRFESDPWVIYCEGELLAIPDYIERQSSVGVAPCPQLAKEFPELVTQYEQVRSKRPDNPKATASPVATQPALGEWERYTLDFIQRYQLDDEQRQKALGVLAECQKDGWAHVARMREELEALEQRRAAARQERDPARRGDVEREIASAREKLTAPLAKIFETQLKPRLDRLPTRAQRLAPSSQPAQP